MSPGKKERFLALEEWQLMCTDCTLINQNFRARDMDIAFKLSLRTHVDELTDDRHTKMSYIEFLEALARVAHVSNFSLLNVFQLLQYSLLNP